MTGQPDTLTVLPPPLPDELTLLLRHCGPLGIQDILRLTGLPFQATRATLLALADRQVLRQDLRSKRWLYQGPPPPPLPPPPCHPWQTRVRGWWG